ncbi:VWA domain-containing protein [Ketobacter sp.]|uniref:VWA domain-containing protein n=1 Tax=Ketobacter sp. TaxID=2083498 RepID=UPI000F1A0859|nr:VWA domain-containing protein [Ketobacter sp.]RLT92807.1 MAG: VWA domain-containing protein [Ketobacter sp.]
MKRIARLSADRFKADDALVGHSELTRILQHHLPHTTAAMFAHPKPRDGNIVEWYSDLDGQPVPFAELGKAEAEALLRLLNERLHSIQQLAQTLKSRGAEGEHQAALLQQAARYPDDSTLFSLNGQPVITFWGYGIRPAPPPPPPAPKPAPAITATPAPAAAAVAPERKGKRWLLLLLLLLLLALLLGLYWSCELRENHNAPAPSAELILGAKNLCPGERPAERAPELVLVFDASGSMEYSLEATKQEITRAQRVFRSQRRNTPPEAWVRATRPPQRITSAKQSAIEAIKKIPEDVNVGLVLVQQCPAGTVLRKPQAGGREQLLHQIQAIQAQGGTPLAHAVAQAGKLVDGVNREAVILVVSDGAESCHGNPCKVAAHLAETKPYLKINVVDILGTGAGNCLAAQTGGKVFTANNVDELTQTMGQAVQDILGADNCTRDE